MINYVNPKLILEKEVPEEKKQVRFRERNDNNETPRN